MPRRSFIILVMKNLITNFDKLATTRGRRLALEIAQAGLAAIDTSMIVKRDFRLESGNVLKIKDYTIDLKTYKKIYVIGFGKASCDAMMAINEVLTDQIASGIAIDIRSVHCANPNIKIYQGSHPKPTPDNMIATSEILELAKNIKQEDLVICIVSGGGSALLCADQNECDLGNIIYDEFLKVSGNIGELNILRKHASLLKGGGLAKLFYPATMVGLIFSDVVSGEMSDVASGPTYLDRSTLADVGGIVDKYNLTALGKAHFEETTKEEKYFERVKNILMVSNHDAVAGMVEKAESLGLEVQIYSEKILEKIPDLARKFSDGLLANQVRIGAGEPVVVTVTKHFGGGGRNQELAMETVPYLGKDQVFISIASDGIDNTPAAGAIADGETLMKAQKAGLNLDDHIKALNSWDFFSKLEDLIFTGPTGANVADLMISLRV